MGVRDAETIAMTSACLNSGGHPNLQLITVQHSLHCLHVCYMYPHIEEYNIIQKCKEKNCTHLLINCGYAGIFWMSISQQPFFLTFTYFHFLNLTHIFS